LNSCHPSQLFQTIDSCTYAQTALLRSYTGNREGSRFARLFENGIGFVPHRWLRQFCRKPHPRTLGVSLPAIELPRIAAELPRTVRKWDWLRSAPRPPPPADWLRFASPDCRRPAHLPIGFVPHQPRAIQRGFPNCHRTVRKWDWLRSAPVAQAFLPRPPPPRIGFVSHSRTAAARHTPRLASFRISPLRVRPPVCRCSPQEPGLSSYTVVTEGSYEKIW
jgi:hypothetical protein